MSQKVAATYHGAGTCKKGCCWTPGLGCARGWKCAHHAADAAREAEAEKARRWERDLIGAAELKTRRGLRVGRPRK